MNAMRRDGMGGIWALDDVHALREIGRQWATIAARVVDLEGVRLKAEADFQAQMDDPRVLMKGSVAVIPMCGPVFNRGNLYSYFFGGAVISTMRAQLQKALTDEEVKAIVFRVDSPGGTTDGCSEFAAEIFKARGVKPVLACCDTLCASAAYWLASNCQEIIATPSAFVGSVGVYWEHDVLARMLQEAGIDVELVASSPEKVETHEAVALSDEAREHWQGIVDQLAGMFAADVARGRGITAKQVRDTYGKGRAFLAKEAMRMGMVDRVSTFDDTIQRLIGRKRTGAQAESYSVEEIMAMAGQAGLVVQAPAPPQDEPRLALDPEATADPPASDADGLAADRDYMAGVIRRAALLDTDEDYASVPV